MQTLEYLDASGRSPFRRWFDRLDPQTAAKIAIALSRLERGNLSNVKDVGFGVLEMRIDFGPGFRVYFGAMAIRWSSCSEVAASSVSNQISATLSCDGRIIRSEKRDRPDMPLTRDFKETVKARAERDPEFRAALLTEAVEQMLSGDVDTGKAVLRDYINATVGFERLARETGTPAKSLMRMFGPNGNPRADNLFAVISRLQKASGVRLGVAVER
jgi:putative component of toxin-antitoxin plasmid stabilization module/DNA-binding phage protein